jgi:hypothetical protein
VGFDRCARKIGRWAAGSLVKPVGFDYCARKTRIGRWSNQWYLNTARQDKPLVKPVGFDHCTRKISRRQNQWVSITALARSTTGQTSGFRPLRSQDRPFSVVL